MAFQLPNGVAIPDSDFSWLGQLATNVTDNVNNKRAGDLILQSLQAKSAAPDASSPQIQVSPPVAQTAPVTPVQRSADQGSTYRPFIDTVQKGGLTNPNGLAAVAAYGRAESGWSGDKANATWSDPSQSGQPGTSGGVLSWRGPRLVSLQQYAASKGEQGNGSPQTQAEFFVREDPQLLQRLNAAKSPQEANSILAQAWKFAGYDKPGGENARRAALAQNYYAQEFGKNAQTQEPGAIDSGRFASGPIAQGADGMAAALSPPQQQATPVQVADAAPPQQQVQPQAPESNVLMAGIAPATKQNVDPNIIRQMVQNPITRPLGLQLAQQVLGGAKSSQEPWQFVKLPNGDLARANQQTGAIERVGNFAKTAGGGEFGLSPIYGVDETGNTVLGQVGKDGSFHRVDTGGFKPVGNTSTLDLGTSRQVRDKAGNVISNVAVDNSGKAEALVTGKSLAESKQALPGVVSRAQTALDSIDSLKNDKYLPNMLGPINSRTPIVTADAERVRSKIDQIKGQSFLGVYDELRGAGAITDIEGQKGTDARARLNTAQNVQDFNKALDDLKEVIQAGVNRAKSTAAGNLSVPTNNNTAGARKTSTGVTWSIEP